MTVPDRYVIQTLFNRRAIIDKRASRVFAFGGGFDFVETGKHRASYTLADAQIVCDWLNGKERATVP